MTLKLSAFVSALALCTTLYGQSNYDQLFDEGLECLETGDYTCAKDRFTRAGEIQRSDSADVMLALSHYMLDSIDESIVLLRNVLSENPTNEEATLLLHEIYDEQENYPEAAKLLSQYIKLNPYNCRVYMARARLSLKYWEVSSYVTSDLESALYFCNDSLNTEVLLTLAEAYYTQEYYEKARNVYTDVLELSPEDPQVNYDVAVYLSDVGDYDSALVLFGKYRLLSPSDSLVYFQVGYCYMALENFEKAVENFTEYLRADSSDAEAWYNRGIANAALNNYDFAIRDLKQALKIDPELTDAHFNLALVYQNKGEYKPSMDHYTKYIYVVEDDPEAWYNRGYCKYYSDDPHGACADWLNLRKLGYKDLWKEVKTLCSGE